MERDVDNGSGIMGVGLIGGKRKHRRHFFFQDRKMLDMRIERDDTVFALARSIFWIFVCFSFQYDKRATLLYERNAYDQDLHNWLVAFGCVVEDKLNAPSPWK